MFCFFFKKKKIEKSSIYAGELILNKNKEFDGI